MAKKVLTYKEVNSRLGSSLPSTNKGCKKSKALEAGSKDMHPTWDSNRLIVYVEQDVVRYTITFKVKHTGELISTIEVVEGGTITKPTPPSLEGYHFVGWSPEVPKKARKNGTYYAVYSTDEIPENALRYFTTVAKGDGSITFNVSSATDADHPTWGVVDEVSYRVWDGVTMDENDLPAYGEWTTFQNPKGQSIVVPNLHNKYEVEWRGLSSGYGIGYHQGEYSYFSSTCNMDIKNNPLTLLYNKDVDTIEDISKMWRLNSNSSYCFCGLFAGCITLTSASDLYFPTYLDSGEHHFCDFFRDCTNLTTASFKCGKREGTMLDSCYERMFLGCSNLTTPPELPAMNLGYACYQAMFSGCTSLTTAPKLPATTLAISCYDRMFGSYSYYTGDYPACTSLTKIEMSAPYTNDWDGVFQHPLRNWAAGITQSGTFVGDSAWIDDTTIPGNLPSTWKS